MVNKAVIKLSALLTAAFLCTMHFLTVNAYGIDFYYQGDCLITKTTYFYDGSNTFSSSEKTEVMKLLNKTSDEIGFNIAVYANGKDASDSRIKQLTVDGAKNLFSDSEYSGTVFLHIDLDGLENAYDTIATYHDAFLYYPDEAFEDISGKIIKAVQANLPPGGTKASSAQVMSGLETFCEQLKYYKNQGPKEGCFYENDISFTVNTKNGKEERKQGEYTVVQSGEIKQAHFKPYQYWYFGLAAGIAIALIVTVIISVSVKKRYKFKASANASVYTSKKKINMIDSQDIFIGKTVTKTKIESNSSSGSSGGGSFGGGHGGGGFSGSHR